MTDTAQQPPPKGTLAHVARRKSAPRAAPYLRLLLLIPSLAMLGIGAYAYNNVEPGGSVESIKLTTKPGPVGEAAEALRLVTGTFDLYLKVKTTDGSFQTQTMKDTAIGNGLIWPMNRPAKLQEVKEVNVWDEHTFRSDKNLDHIVFDGTQWAAEGQTFHLDLIGKPNVPPTWALPLLSVGATLSGLIVLRFVWDQVI